MPSCVVKKCKNQTHKQLKRTGVTYHLFPQEQVRRKTWIKIIQRERGDQHWQPSRKSVICSAHFNHNQMYDTEGQRRRLMKTAIPDLIDKSRDDHTTEAVQPCGSQSNRNVKIKKQNLERKKTTGPSSGTQKVEENLITREIRVAEVTSHTDDKYDVLGKYVALKVRQLDSQQRMYAERIIHEAIYEGQMGHLNINSQLVVNTETFATRQTDKTKGSRLEITKIKEEKDNPVKESEYENDFEESPNLGDFCCKSNSMSLEKPNDMSESNFKDVPDIKIEIVTAEDESLPTKLSSEYHDTDEHQPTTKVGEYVYMYSDRSAKRKRPDETDYGGNHSAFPDSNAKTDSESKDNFNSQEIQFGSDSNVKIKIKEELSDS